MLTVTIGRSHHNLAALSRLQTNNSPIESSDNLLASDRKLKRSTPSRRVEELTVIKATDIIDLDLVASCNSAFIRGSHQLPPFSPLINSPSNSRAALAPLS